LGAEKPPRHDAAGVDEVLDKVVGFGHGVAGEGGRWQVVILRFRVTKAVYPELVEGLMIRLMIRLMITRKI
jgi:hypothetical protein